ncbi:MAG: type IV toxin-antitoxin system AbiEi family antitoxin [Myxococcaceae bacterium]
MKYNSTTLSKRETLLLADWERARRSRVALGEIVSSVGTRAAPDVVRGLVRKRVLERIGRGVYVIRPLRALSRPNVFSSSSLVASLLEGKPYYLGGLWALSLHGLTTQVHGAILDVYVPRPLKPRELGNARVRFHKLRPDAFTYGLTETTVEGRPTRVSDPERTLLDALDYPQPLGGMRPALTLVTEALARVNHRRLIAHAVKGSRTSTCQRLGLLLERAGVSTRTLAPVRARTAESRSLLSMLPGAPRRGPVHATWQVVENDT